MKNTFIISICSMLILIGCNSSKESLDNKNAMNETNTIGVIDRLDPIVNKIIAEDAQIEVLAEGFTWSEGPVWIEDGEFLLFSDVPANIVHKWEEGGRLSTYLNPSGFTKPEGKGEGSNGLLINSNGQLVICQHGDRRVAFMNAPLSSPESMFTTITDNYNGKKFNSPNDAAYHSNGDLYFTDPPYGLSGQDDNPAKELPFSGVFKTDKEGNTVLLDDQLKRPNGIAFSPDEKSLYVANSYYEDPIIQVYDVKENGLLENGRIFFDTKPLLGEGVNGLPDGMKVNDDGIIFATGPGGVLILSPEGKHLGTVNPGVSVANVAIGGDGYLYLTAHMYLIRIKLL